MVAHELGHIAADHMGNRQFLGTLPTTADLICQFNLLAKCISSWSGVMACVYSGAAFVVTTSVLAHAGFDLENQDDKERAGKICSIVGNSTFLASAYLSGRHELIAAWAVEKVVTTTTQIISASLSRRNEFQADRIGVELTQNPQSLSSGLRKIEKYNCGVDPKLALSDYRNGSLITQAYKRLKTVLRSHPNTDRRCARLAKMARRLEKCAAASA